MEILIFFFNFKGIFLFVYCRDLPLAALISLLLIAAVYTLTNMAYFTALAPIEVLKSPAVALVGETCMFNLTFETSETRIISVHTVL